MTGPTKSRRDENMEATRQALLDAAREAFTEDGYSDASAEAISRSARVTRGAFYHHFADKQALFEAVVIDLQREAARAIEARARKEADLWKRLAVGIDVYLDACVQPSYARIVVKEARAVLGEVRFSEIDRTYIGALLATNMRALDKAGALKPVDIPTLTRLLDGMICALAIMLTDTTARPGARKRGQLIIHGFLESLRQ